MQYLKKNRYKNGEGSSRRPSVLPIINWSHRCWIPPGHYLWTTESGRLSWTISIQIDVNGDAYPVTIGQKVVKILPVPRRGLNNNKRKGKEMITILISCKHGIFSVSQARFFYPFYINMYCWLVVLRINVDF